MRSTAGKPIMGLQVTAALAVVILAPVGVSALIGAVDFMTLVYSNLLAVFKSKVAESLSFIGISTVRVSEPTRI